MKSRVHYENRFCVFFRTPENCREARTSLTTTFIRIFARRLERTGSGRLSFIGVKLVESGFWGRVGRLGTALGFFLRFTSERQLSRATGSCDLALRKNPTS